jgi:hypothetical protein
MAQLEAPGGTSLGPITRLGKPAADEADLLGPLANLNGTWFGSRGWELIAVPNFASGPNAFRLILRPYIEVITFTPIGAQVPDRGAKSDLFITGLVYEMRICDAETNEPLHLETGMWFYLPGQEQEIARSATIPHGDAMLALGSHLSHPGGPKIQSDVSAIPVVNDAPLGYLDPYLNQPGPFHPHSINDTLLADNEGLDILATDVLEISTQSPGGILNIPFVTQNANATELNSIWWIEQVQSSDPDHPIMQLQYTQTTSMEFIEQPDKSGLINWPHVNVNTLRKQ